MNPNTTLPYEKGRLTGLFGYKVAPGSVKPSERSPSHDIVNRSSSNLINWIICRSSYFNIIIFYIRNNKQEILNNAYKADTKRI